jgi:hypothetical protein
MYCLHGSQGVPWGKAGLHSVGKYSQIHHTDKRVNLRGCSLTFPMNVEVYSLLGLRSYFMLGIQKGGYGKRETESG